MLVMNQVVVSRAFLNFETIMFKFFSEIGIHVFLDHGVFNDFEIALFFSCAVTCMSFNGMQHLFRRCYQQIKV